MTIFDDYDRYDAVGLAHLVREGATTAGELLETAIARLEAVDPVINAVSVKMYDEAQAAIDRGLPDGPLRGVPFLLKPGVASAENGIFSLCAAWNTSSFVLSDSHAMIAASISDASWVRATIVSNPSSSSTPPINRRKRW